MQVLAKLFGGTLKSIACKHMVLLAAVLVLKLVLLPALDGPGPAPRMGGEVVGTRIREDKFVEVPQMKWGLNNQKIGFAKACLTARMLNRTLVMPTLSATLFGNTPSPISFDQVFHFHKFNTLCAGFVRLARHSHVFNTTEVLHLRKGSGSKWTVERDLSQLRAHRQGSWPDHEYEVIRIVGEHPFFWRDHWPVRDYARVFECLHVIDVIGEEADRVVHMIRAKAGAAAAYVAVHMRVEHDWMRHCKNLEDFYGTNQICSGKAEIIERVESVCIQSGLKAPVVVYLAAAEALLHENGSSSSSIVEGWGEGFVAVEKRRLGVGGVYDKYPYLIQSAIDYQVCLNADIFVGNSFSTFSSLVVLDRTHRMIKAGATSTSTMCAHHVRWPSYAYNVAPQSNGPARWNANISHSTLDAITYGTTHISC